MRRNTQTQSKVKQTIQNPTKVAKMFI